MDEKTFKRHLKDLVHGKHNTSEHDWSSDGVRPSKTARRTVKKRAKRASR